MKLKKLQIDYEYDFVLFGVISSVKGFKLAWSINQALSVELVKVSDIDFTLRDRKNLKVISYQFETENSKYILLNNKLKDSGGADSGYVLPEMAKIDFLLRIDGETYPNTPEKILMKLKDLSTVEYVLRVDVNKLKSKENLLLY